MRKRSSRLAGPIRPCGQGKSLSGGRKESPTKEKRGTRHWNSSQTSFHPPHLSGGKEIYEEGKKKDVRAIRGGKGFLLGPPCKKRGETTSSLGDLVLSKAERRAAKGIRGSDTPRRLEEGGWKLPQTLLYHGKAEGESAALHVEETVVAAAEEQEEREAGKGYADTSLVNE